MTHSHDTRRAPLAAFNASSDARGFGGLLGALDRVVVQPLLALHRGRLARRELMALDDRELADIGLHRSEIEMALTQPWRIGAKTEQATAAGPANVNRRTANAA
jgi:uncharacterized protein YjiS (DUF1127 family)